MPIQQMLLANPVDVAYASFTATGKASGVALSGSNLIATWSSNGGGVKTDKAILSGEVKYWENVVSTLVSIFSLGVGLAALDVSSNAFNNVGGTTNGLAFGSNGNLSYNGSTVLSTGVSSTTGDVIGFVLDRSGSGSLVIRKNNTVIGTYNNAIVNQDWIPTVATNAAGSIITLQTGSLTYAVPSGASKLTL